MDEISIREDFRRDGLAANFLVDEKIMHLLSKAIPGSIINVGYPGICKEEEQYCINIVRKLKNSPVESAVVGHADKEHLIKMATVANMEKNTSGNIWIPISDSFISKTLKKSPDTILEDIKSLIYFWKKISPRPIDIALADATNPKEELSSRLNKFYKELKKAGARTIILCDTTGKVTPNKLVNLIKGFKNKKYSLEYHAHNDNGNALKNIKVAKSYGITRFGTAFFNHSERSTLLDPRELISEYNLKFDKKCFLKFKFAYYKKMGNPKSVGNIFDKKSIVTGTQYRLRNRNKKLILKFGVTSDTYILRKMVKDNFPVTKHFFEFLKNNLYLEKRKFYTEKDIQKKYKLYKKVPQVSIIFSIYGNFDKRRLELAIKSLNLQKGINYETIVVEENKSPFFKKNAKKLDSRYVFIKHKSENISYDPGKVRNAAAKKVRGEFIYLNDADIIFKDKFFLKNSVENLNKTEGLAYYRPPMRKLLLEYFELFHSLYKKKGIEEAINKLNFSQDHLAVIGKKQHEMKVVTPPGKEGIEEFIAPIEEYLSYKKDPSLKKYAPLIFNGTRHWGGILMKSNDFSFLGGYHEGFKKWGCEDTDLQWKISEMMGLKFFPLNEKFEVIHLDHEKGYFCPEKLEENKKQEDARKEKGIIDSLMNDRGVFLNE